MTPSYYLLDCIPTPDGGVRVVDIHGGVGRGLAMMDAAYGGRSAAARRLLPYMQRLGEMAGGKRLLFIIDPFTARQPFPDDFFNWVERFSAYGPLTDWVPDLQGGTPNGGAGKMPSAQQIGMFLDPLAHRLRLKLAYCSGARLDHAHRPRGKKAPVDGPCLLLSDYRDRARQRGSSVAMSLADIGVALFSGIAERFPDDLKRSASLPSVNAPLLDQALESKWTLPLLLEGTRAEKLLPHSVPAGLGLRTGAELMAFAGDRRPPSGFPLAVLKPSLLSLSPGVRFMDRTALRALASRQPEHRLPPGPAQEAIAPRISHTYEEISGYRGKQLDNLLRTPGAHVHDHRDGSFHFTAPYPFLESAVGVLQEFVEGRPVRSRRTGKLHPASLHVVMFDRRVVAAVYRMHAEPEDGTFRDLNRPGTPIFYEGASPDDEAAIHGLLAPFVAELESQFAGRVHSEADLHRLRERWVLDHAAV